MCAPGSCRDDLTTRASRDPLAYCRACTPLRYLKHAQPSSKATSRYPEAPSCVRPAATLVLNVAAGRKALPSASAACRKLPSSVPTVVANTSRRKFQSSQIHAAMPSVVPDEKSWLALAIALRQSAIPGVATEAHASLGRSR